MGLEQYTTEELQAELKRRKAQSVRKNDKPVRKPKQYAELTGEVTHVSRPSHGNKVGNYSFKVRFNDAEFNSFVRVNKYQNNFEYFAVDKSIKKLEELPEVGDKVVVRSRTDAFFPPFVGTNWEQDNRIIKVIKQ
jgi:hypothetical protein